MGAVKKIVLSLTVLLVAVSYWLYSPVPDGYSTSSTNQLRVVFATMKIVNFVSDVGEYLGFASSLNITRSFAALSELDTSDPDVWTQDVTFDGIPVRVYTPVGEKKVRPGIVYIHGGGWQMGSVNIYHPLVTLLCKLTNTVIVSVEYRLAPESLFPAAHDDCAAATKYFMKHAAEYDVDPNRIAVAGDSAGGNLAATVVLRLRDESFEPKLAMQVLIYPGLQAVDFQLPSMQQNAHDPVYPHRKTVFYKCMYLDGNESLAEAYRNNGHVSPKFMKEMSETYLNVDRLPERFLKGYRRPTSYTGSAEIWESVRGRILNPYFSPLMAADLTRLPMTYLFTCEHDLLRDEGLLYEYRLKEAGNKVKSVHSDIAFHGVISFAGKLPEARIMLDDIVTYIVSNL